jgi:hypothetical protein
MSKPCPPRHRHDAGANPPAKQAENAVREALRIAEASALSTLKAKATFQLVVCLAHATRWREALEYGEAGADLFAELGRQNDVLSLSINNAKFATHLHNPRKELSWAKRAADLADRLGEVDRHALAMLYVAWANENLRDWWSCLEAAFLAERLYEAQENWWNAAEGARTAARAAQHLDQHDIACTALARAADYLTNNDELSARRIETLIYLSAVQVRAGQYEPAAATLEKAKRISREQSKIPFLMRREATVRWLIVSSYLEHPIADDSSDLARIDLDGEPAPTAEDVKDELLDSAFEHLAFLRTHGIRDPAEWSRLLSLPAASPIHGADLPDSWFYEDLDGDASSPLALSTAEELSDSDNPR